MGEGAIVARRAVSFLYVLLMVALPCAALIFEAFRSGPAEFSRQIASPQAMASVTLTVVFSIIAALISVVGGTLIAYVILRGNPPFRRAMESLVDLPLALPAIVTGLLLVSLYGPQGIVGGFLEGRGIQVLFARPGVLLGMLVVTLPYVVRSVQSVLDTIPVELETAASTLGASPTTAFWKVTFPLLKPGIATGAGLAFARAMGEFGSLILIAGNIPFKSEVASVYIYGRIESGLPQAAAAVATILLMISVVSLLVVSKLQRARLAYAK